MEDKTFMATFQAIIFFLIVLTVILIGFTFAIGKVISRQEVDPLAEEAAIVKHISPVGQVAISGGGAASGPRSGKQLAETVCQACHGSGVMGAPKLGVQADWEARLARGVDTILDNAINGIAAMPPRGGDATLSDEELKAAVDYMLQSVGASL